MMTVINVLDEEHKTKHEKFTLKLERKVPVVKY